MDNLNEYLERQNEIDTRLANTKKELRNVQTDFAAKRKIWKNEGRIIAEDYFQQLISQLNGSEHAELIKSDKLYRGIDSFLFWHCNHESTSDEKRYESLKHIRIKDYRAYYCTSEACSTFFERYPAINKQLSQVLSQEEDLYCFHDGMFYYKTSAKELEQLISREKDSLTHAEINSGEMGMRRKKERIHDLLLEATLKEDFDKPAFSVGIKTGKTYRQIMPSKEFMTEILKLSNWYKKCISWGYNPGNQIVKRNAREVEYENY